MAPALGWPRALGKTRCAAKASALASSATPPSALGYPSPKGEAPPHAGAIHFANSLSSKQNIEGQLHNQKLFYFANAGRRQGPWMLMRNKTSKSLICRHCTLTPTLSLEGRGSKGLAVTPFFSPRTPGAERGLGCSQAATPKGR